MIKPSHDWYSNETRECGYHSQDLSLMVPVMHMLIALTTLLAE